MQSEMWNELRVNGQLCDGVIKTSDGGSFPVHRVILGAFSPYFRAYFTNSLNQGQPEFKDMMIDDVPRDIVATIIDFAYTGTCTLTAENVQAVMISADRFSCEPLVQFCSNFISNNINPQNCVATLRFARSYLFRDLEMMAWQFSCDRIEEVMFTQDFLTFTADELTELLSADELNVLKEEVVYDAVCRWIQEEPETRREHFPQLLQCIRFGLVNLEYFSNKIRNCPFGSEESLNLLKTINALFDTSENSYYYNYCYYRPRIPNEVIFTFGGWSEGSPTNLIETYDKRSDAWYISPVRDQTIRAYHGVVVLDTLIYVIGGFDGTNYFSTMHCFNPITSTWTEKACMHDVRCYVSICTLGGEIYAIGGFNGRTRLNTAEKYNPSMNQWTMIAPLSKLRSDASAASLNNKIYVAGGFNGQEVMRSVEVYNPFYNRWDFVDSMTTPRSGVSLITYNRYIYALGGFDGINRLHSCERYNPIYNRWDQIADMLCPRSNMASVIVDKSILVMGGYNGSITVPMTEFYYEDENRWYMGNPMNIHRSALSACVVRRLPNAKNYTFLGSAVDPTVDGAGELIKINL